MTEIRAIVIDGELKTKFIPSETDTIETFLNMYSGITAHLVTNMVTAKIPPEECSKLVISAVQAGVDMAIEEAKDGEKN